MDQDIEQRFARLETEDRELRVKHARLEAMQARGRGGVPGEISDKQAAPNARLDIGTSISVPVAAISNFDAPNPEELAALRKIIGNYCPQLLNSDHCATWHRHVAQEENDEAWHKQFAAGFSL